MKFLGTKHRDGLKNFLISLLAFTFALLIGAILIQVSGFSAIDTYKAIFQGSLGSTKGIVLSLSQATPLLLTGLAFAIAFRVRLINTGAEGQLYTGAMVSALIGAYIANLPPFLHSSLAVLLGMVAGGLVGIFMGFLKIKYKANEVIMGIMLNEVLILITNWMSTGPFKAPGSPTSQTVKILDSARLVKIVPKSQLTTAILIAVVMAILLEFLLRKTALGYEIKVIGMNLRAAETAGINVSRVYLFTIFVSGAMAGLAGAALSLGIHYRFIEGISTGFGFSGISVAALAQYSPIGVLFSSFLFGALRAGAMTLNRTTAIPIEFVSVIQALVVVFVAAPKVMSSLIDKLGNKVAKRKEGKETDDKALE